MFVAEMKKEIEKQLEGVYEYSPIRGVCEQLSNIVRENEQLAQIVCEDFANGRTVSECEREIKKWVDKNHKGSVGYCPPWKAEEIIRQYFGLAKTMEQPKVNKPKVMSLADLL